MQEITRVHTAWARLCAAAGRSSLTVGEALDQTAKGPEGDRNELAAALLGTGHPDALESRAALGAALRVLREVTGEDGAWITRVHRGRGNRWYVWRPEVRPEAIDQRRVREVLTCVEGGPTVTELREALRQTLGARAEPERLV